jgi:hypothetical protein
MQSYRLQLRDPYPHSGGALEKTGKLTMHRLIFRLIGCWKQRFLYVRCS